MKFKVVTSVLEELLYKANITHGTECTEIVYDTDSFELEVFFNEYNDTFGATLFVGADKVKLTEKQKDLIYNFILDVVANHKIEQEEL